MSRSLEIDSSNSPPEVKSRWAPVTRFSSRPDKAFGLASLRTFTTYARRVGYFDSGLSDIAVRSYGLVEGSEHRRRSEATSCQRTVAVPSGFHGFDEDLSSGGPGAWVRAARTRKRLISGANCAASSGPA